MGNCTINSECTLQKIKGSTRGKTNCIKQSGPWRRGYVYLTNKVSFPIPEERTAQAMAETGDLNLSQDTKGKSSQGKESPCFRARRMLDDLEGTRVEKAWCNGKGFTKQFIL